MVLTRRERYIVIGAAIAVGVLAIDRLALSPLLAAADAAETQRSNLRRDLDRMQAALDNRKRLTPKWREMVQQGMKNDPAEAESQVLHAVQDWAGEAGLTLSLLKPDRLSEKSRLPQISFMASGTGNVRAIARLLWRVQTATIPLKTTDLQIVTRKEGTDDISFTLRISTVYSSAPAEAGKATSRRADAAGGS